MPEGLTFLDLRYLISVKLCFFTFIAFGIFGIYRKYKPVYFLTILGIFLSTSYFIFVRHTGLMFWGLTGDEITIAAMYEKFAHLSFWSDFSYSHLPPFYPPLFFWIGALFGKLFNWNGIQMAKMMSFVTMLIYPVFFYLVQKLYWKNAQDQKNNPDTIAWMIASLLLFVVIEDDAIIDKPYELISASLTILWSAFLLRDSYYGNLNMQKIFIYGISGGILFLLFYFWFFLVAIGVGLFHLCTKFNGKVKSWMSYILIGIMTLAISSPFWLPLAKSYTTHGSENWQAGYFLIEGISLQGLRFNFDVTTILLLVGFVCLCVYRKQIYHRALLSLFVSAYVWQIMGMLTLLFLASPMQESKGFYFFNHILLAISFAYGIERLWMWFKTKPYATVWTKSIAIVSLCIVGSELFFGTFTDIPVVQQTRATSLAPRQGVMGLVDFLKTQNIQDTITLHSGVTELYAFIPVNDFLYYNMNNSHPAAGFSNRMLVVEDMARAKTSQDLWNLVHNNSITPIDRLVFFNQTGEVYPLYYHIDNFPQVNKEKVIKIPKKLFDKTYFVKVYESDEFVVFEPRIDM
ncbi:MAG: arabinofuranosyltransferase [Candidatus Magasanikbacteria bacterium]|nr:arabinofuranosyltransferase [Candidatus Magasanikbacteria bacterium]